jgi:predicted ATP-grasp superfamily ATP-dependent carboligase
MADQLPKLALFCEEGAFFPLSVVESARGLCRMVWVLGSVPVPAGVFLDNHAPSMSRRALGRMGDVVEVDGLDPQGITEALSPLGLDGLMVLSEGPQIIAAEVAAGLGLPYHSLATAHNLSDKLSQRRALAAAGVPVPWFVAIDPAQLDSTGPRLPAGARFPAVLKPRTGGGSRFTFMVTSPEELTAALALCPDQGFILEGYVPDRRQGEALLADDVISVEAVVQGGEVYPLVVTGRFPIAHPFRSTGAFMPANLSDHDTGVVNRTVIAAVKSLGVQRGVVNVDLKFSPDGPRVLEVNGRVGGGVPALLAGINGPPLLDWHMRLALGTDVGPVVPLPPAPVAFNRLVVPPVEAGELVSVGGLDQLSAVSGVRSLTLNRHPGQPVDYREGGAGGHVLLFEGVVPTHADLERVLAEADAVVGANIRYR